MERRSARQRKRARMSRLWKEQEGCCHWCGCQMLHWNDLRSDPTKREACGVKVVNGVEKIKVMPERMATLEHLFDRFHPERKTPANGAKRWALACNKCNAERGKRSQSLQSINDLRERSKRHPSALVSQLDGNRNSTSAYAGSSPAEGANTGDHQ